MDVQWLCGVFFNVPMKWVLLSTLSLSWKPRKDISESLGFDIKRQALWRGTLQSCHQSTNISATFSLCCAAKEQPFAMSAWSSRLKPRASFSASMAHMSCSDSSSALLWKMHVLPPGPLALLGPWGLASLQLPLASWGEFSSFPICVWRWAIMPSTSLQGAWETQPAGELCAGKAEQQAVPVCEQAAAAEGALPSTSKHLLSAQRHGITYCVSGFEWTWWGVCMEVWHCYVVPRCPPSCCNR